MNSRIKKIISCMAVILLLLIIIVKESSLFERKSSIYKYAPFFEHAEDIDVFFLGSSHAVNSEYPMELWKDHGITSYNLAGDGNAIATTYWVFENALDYTTPEVVVVDCFLLSNNDKSTIKFEYVHTALDAFPLSYTKYRAARDFTDDEQRDIYVEENASEVTGEKPSTISLLWDFSVYHSRWKELGERDFHEEKTLQYGAEYRVDVVRPVESVPGSGECLDDNTLAMDYLERILDECSSKGIKVIMTYLPFPADETARKEANSARLIAQKHDVDYIDFLDMDIVDLNTDCCDATSHLNPSGARKITGYLGNYLEQNCQLEDHRGDERYSYWEDSYHEYEKMKIDYLNKQKNPEEYLMLLADDDLDWDIRIYDTWVLSYDMIPELILNLGIDTESTPDTPFEIKRKSGTISFQECTPDEKSCKLAIDVYYPQYASGAVSTFTYP